MSVAPSNPWLAPRKAAKRLQKLPLCNSLDLPGRLRVGHWLALLSIGQSTYYARRTAGTLPEPDGNDGRPYWNTATVRAYFER